MFEIERRQCLEDLHWEPEDGGLYFVETPGFTPESEATTTIPKIRHGLIEECDIDNWLRETTPSSTTTTNKHGGTLRILCISKPKRHHSAQLSITKETFLKVEDAFHLSKGSVCSLFNSSGVFAKFTEYDPTSRTPTCLRLVVKSKQKVGVGNWLASVCHDYTTGRTDAVICSEGMLTPIPDDHNATHTTQAAKFVENLEQYPHLWRNPLLIPTLMIRLFCEKIQVNRIKVADKLVDLENEMGVTFAGRSKAKRSMDNWPENLDIKAVTIGLNSTGASILYLSQTCIWALDSINFLIKMANEVGLHHSDLWLTCTELKEVLEYESSAMEGISLTMKTKRERIQAQLNTLYSAASQKENAIALQYSRMAQEQNELAQRDVQLNTRIATSTKKDSVAMTIFTFITASFLPGTYIASLFSMSMFDWLHDDDEGTVSPLLWVYWLVTIPLTAIVLAGWWLWYKRADREWQKETGCHLDGTADEQSSIGSEKLRTMS
ncbi:uncharacterized protein HMPREF1541_07634 [Cyphellophora europaea CBS 101466]|uniref:Uncharacterized protein n=1 Tax=Cyphellophora europaea (strain CBS 101466) TaxID=1220924 RepID=W2RND0_CYPE1|nr:uncharacterized protein HMPREF1541_07634 [Cyphellophora europaea CBS 101466]ETN38011.1 hypothetical protein HMPREF1541_07634 [Cyphellophora europaea CBS 101466]